MKRTTFLFVIVATLAGVAFRPNTSRDAMAQEAAPIFVKKVPAGYRDWKVVSVAHEEGDLNDIRAILGNDIAIKAYRDGKHPFPEGAIVGRIAWSHVASEENNKVFGRNQSFVAGSPTNFYLQFMVKDSKKYVATGGWGYSSFDKDGKPTDEAGMKTCFPCHQKIQDRDFIFTRYAPSNGNHSCGYGTALRRQRRSREGALFHFPRRCDSDHRESSGSGEAEW